MYYSPLSDVQLAKIFLFSLVTFPLLNRSFFMFQAVLIVGSCSYLVGVLFRSAHLCYLLQQLQSYRV